jgi:hypothetical protein
MRINGGLLSRTNLTFIVDPICAIIIVVQNLFGHGQYHQGINIFGRKESLTSICDKIAKQNETCHSSRKLQTFEHGDGPQYTQ